MGNFLRFWRDNPVIRIVLVGCLLLAFYLSVRDPFGGDGGGDRTWKVQLFLELMLFGTLSGVPIILFLGLFSLFVLPVQRFRERVQAWLRLGLFMMGGHGQALWVKDGSVEGSPRNADHWRHPFDPKPGVLILDGASGAQLKTSNRYSRTCGPGLKFIRSHETLAGMVFLGRQVSFPPIRPEDLRAAFAPQGERESDEDYQARVEERKGVSGHTRDGVETLPFMLVGFQLDSKLPPVGVGSRDDKSSKTLFKYNPEAVRRAVNADALDSDAQDYFSEDRHIPWNDFPGYLVAELWREYVRKFTLTELFKDFPDGHDFAGMTALEVIRERIKARLTQPNDVVLDTYGNVIRQRAPCREYHLLREWGIKAIFAPVRNPCFSPEIEETLVKEWFSFWKWRAEDERKYIQRKRTYMSRQGRINALATYVKVLLEDALPKIQSNSKEINATLSTLLYATKQLCISDIEFSRIVKKEDRELQKIIDWLNWLESKLV